MYRYKQIEQKWIEKWSSGYVDYTCQMNSDSPRKYILVEFPFPSGAGLHVGHVRSYVAQDIKARMARMQGYNVLYPIGWDAFGLPTENYAIQHSIPPQKATVDNIAYFKKQLSMLGLSFDWSVEIDTTDPHYYRWTQWIFLQMFKQGLAYQDTTQVWWCEALKTVLANEEVIDGKSERGGYLCERIPLTQWMLRITEYAERLDSDLDTVDYLPIIKTQQRNWIGKSEGVKVKFAIDSHISLEVFTTRIDTIYGVTFLVIAPEHPFLESITTTAYRDEVRKYQDISKAKSDLDRQQSKDKTGVFTGSYAIHPLTQEKIPIWISDYVLMSYGTGAVMAVPAHDERDQLFAEQYILDSLSVIDDNQNLINSGQFNGLFSEEAQKQISEYLIKRNLAKKETQYKLRDWVFSRQRYWGEPFPIVWVSAEDYQKIGAEIQLYLPEIPVSRVYQEQKQYAVPILPQWLPVVLPEVDSYLPQGLGEGPLAQKTDWVNVKYHIQTGEVVSMSVPVQNEADWIEGRRETDTMPNWAGSSWYYLRYIDPHNGDILADLNKLKQWLPIDLYNGGMEHVTLHLLYSRFWHKFLFDIGVVPTPEPYQKRIAHGMILAEGGVKMSKSKGNTIDPMEMVESFGADSLRLYEMFMGPYDEAIAWDTNGLIGCHRFLHKVIQWIESYTQDNLIEEELSDIDFDMHSLVKKVSQDIELSKYNTAISACMEFVNTYQKFSIGKQYFLMFIQLLAPFAPHISEELWEMLGMTSSVHSSQWPQYDEIYLQKSLVQYQIHIRGKMKYVLAVPHESDTSVIESLARQVGVVESYYKENPQADMIIKPEKNIIIII